MDVFIGVVSGKEYSNPPKVQRGEAVISMKMKYYPNHPKLHQKKKKYCQKRCDEHQQAAQVFLEALCQRGEDVKSRKMKHYQNHPKPWQG